MPARVQTVSTSSGVPPMVIWVLGIALIAAHVMVTGTGTILVQASRGQAPASPVPSVEVVQVIGGFILVAVLAGLAEASTSGGTIAVLLLIGLWLAWGLRNLAFVQQQIAKVGR